MPSICLTPLHAGGKQQGIVRVAGYPDATTKEVAVIYMHTGRRSTESGVLPEPWAGNRGVDELECEW
jgi:hypothetical protein